MSLRGFSYNNPSSSLHFAIKIDEARLGTLQIEDGYHVKPPSHDAQINSDTVDFPCLLAQGTMYNDQSPRSSDLYILQIIESRDAVT